MPATEPVRELSAADARRIAVAAQLLGDPRPTNLAVVVERLAVVQADLVDVVAPSADVVAWSRIGSAYRRGAIEAAVADGTMIEFDGLVRPAADYALLAAEMERWRSPDGFDDWRQRTARWALANDRCRRDILRTLREDGPLPVKALPDTTEVPWRSSGWNNDRNVRMLVTVMEQRGEVATVGRDGKDRLWDLAERVYPDVPAVPYDEAQRQRSERRLAALGIARAKAASTPGEPNDVATAGEPAVVDGVRGVWRVDPVYLDADIGDRVALLSPLDRLVYDRKRMVELFEFDYQLEMFKPAAKRRWGYWALPVLAGDRLVGKLDATADVAEGRLFVDAVHEDGRWPAQLRRRVDDEIAALAEWLGVEVERA